MSTVRIALANVRMAASCQESVQLATATVAEAGRQGALVVCFPECFVPRIPLAGSCVPAAADPAFLEARLGRRRGRGGQRPSPSSWARSA
ncbi:MAG: hypothetical protein R3E12_11400 [Candidatus Eisenbacteria bacterium]